MRGERPWQQWLLGRAQWHGLGIGNANTLRMANIVIRIGKEGAILIVPLEPSSFDRTLQQSCL